MPASAWHSLCYCTPHASFSLAQPLLLQQRCHLILGTTLAPGRLFCSWHGGCMAIGRPPRHPQQFFQRLGTGCIVIPPLTHSSLAPPHLHLYTHAHDPTPTGHSYYMLPKLTSHITVDWKNNVSGWHWYCVIGVNPSNQTVKLLPVNSPDGRYIGNGPVRWHGISDMAKWEET